MTDHAENKVSRFYNSVGWETEGDVTEDAKRFEDLRACSSDYVSKCRLRVLRHIPETGEHILDMASGPIQYPEYLEFSKHFEKRHCVDLSAGALAQAEKKIGDNGVFHHGSFLDLPMEENFFDCSISLHTIYHIEREKQEDVVRKLIRVTKPGKPVIIVYSNPLPLLTRWSPKRLAGNILRMLGLIKTIPAMKAEDPLYFHAHRLDWWDRFGNEADIQILPWRSFLSRTQKSLFPDNTLGKSMFRLLYFLEEKFPDFFARNFEYPMIILRKRG
jgi:ubiquinone/menaquinone biosynthesis C-methylase UbiE